MRSDDRGEPDGDPRLHRSEEVPIEAIVRTLGMSRKAVRRGVGG
jgi:hypothetical protein